MTTSCELESDVKYWRLVILMVMTMAATMGVKAAETSADERLEALSSAEYAWRRAQFIFRAGKRSEEHTSELQSLMRNPYAVFCLTTHTRSPSLSAVHQLTILYHITNYAQVSLCSY